MVPNHMAIPVPESLNRQLWSVLCARGRLAVRALVRRGLGGAGGRLLLPILAGPLEDCLRDLIIDTAAAEPGEPGHRGPVLRYFDHVLPVRAGTAGLPLAAAGPSTTGSPTGATPRPSSTGGGSSTSLAHRGPGRGPGRVRRHPRGAAAPGAEGLIDGLRVDHPDGLADPRGYLARLAAETGGAWVVAEKILAHGEELPGLGLRGHHRVRRARPGRRPVHGPRRGRPADRRVRPLHRRQAELRRRWTGTPSATSPTAPSPPSWPGWPGCFARAGIPGPGRLHRRRPARRAGRAAGRVPRLPGVRDPGRAAVPRRRGGGDRGRRGGPGPPGGAPAPRARRGADGGARPGRDDRRRGSAGRAGRTDRAVRPDQRARCWPRASRTPRSTAGRGWSR